MNREEIGDYLSLYFRKRSASFLANIYKAGITTDSRDIHRARLDVKKIFALYGLFEMVSPELFGELRGYRIFRPLYRQAGKIREMQVNQILLSTPEFSTLVIPEFTRWLRHKEERAVGRFTDKVREFREKELKAMGREVETICKGGKLFRLRSKTRQFVLARAEMIRQILAGPTDTRGLHQIRKHLKAIATIVTLVQSVKPNREQEDLISALNRTEMMIGDWHDRVVLSDAATRYLREIPAEAGPERETLESLIRLLKDGAENLTNHFIPEVITLTGMIGREEQNEEESV